MANRCHKMESESQASFSRTPLGLRTTLSRFLGGKINSSDITLCAARKDPKTPVSYATEIQSELSEENLLVYRRCVRGPRCPDCEGDCEVGDPSSRE
jgi:hypothetical protein